MKHTWISLRGDSDLFYLDFRDISGIISSNWEVFENDFPSQNWICAKLEDLTRCRNLIAHNSFIDNQEFNLIKVHFNLISRQLGATKLKLNNSFRKTEDDKEFVIGLKDSLIWTYQQAFDGIDYNIKFPKTLEVSPLFVHVFFLQVDLMFHIEYLNGSLRLPIDFSIGRNSDENNEVTWLKDEVIFQIGMHDIDNDGLDELFICMTNGDENLGAIEIKVLKYFPSALIQHAIRPENWELLGDFQVDTILGSAKASINNGSITIPRNLRGFYHEWTIVKGQFMDTGNF